MPDARRHFHDLSMDGTDEKWLPNGQFYYLTSYVLIIIYVLASQLASNTISHRQSSFLNDGVVDCNPGAHNKLAGMIPHFTFPATSTTSVSSHPFTVVSDPGHQFLAVVCFDAAAKPQCTACRKLMTFVAEGVVLLNCRAETTCNVCPEKQQYMIRLFYDLTWWWPLRTSLNPTSTARQALMICEEEQNTDIQLPHFAPLSACHRSLTFLFVVSVRIKSAWWWPLLSAKYIYC